MNAASVATDDDAAPALPAAGSSFYLAMRILPRARREAMYAIYAFCRAVDDVADGDAARNERLAALAALARRHRPPLRLRADGRPRRCAPPSASSRLRREDFHAVIDGMAMDAAADIRAPDWATLDLYCDRVASAVGRLSTRIFGLDDEPGLALAHHLGRALQLTNILRDLDEDAALGPPLPAARGAGGGGHRRGTPRRGPRRSAPRRRLRRGGRPRRRSISPRPSASWRSGPRRAMRAPRLMAVAYRAILERLVRSGLGARRAGASPPTSCVSPERSCATG